MRLPMFVKMGAWCAGIRCVLKRRGMQVCPVDHFQVGTSMLTVIPSGRTWSRRGMGGASFSSMARACFKACDSTDIPRHPWWMPGARCHRRLQQHLADKLE